MKPREIVFICITIVCIIATGMFFIYNNSNSYVLKINGEKVSQEDFETNLVMQKNYMELVMGKTIDWTELDEIAGVPNIDIAKEYAKELTVDTVVKLQEAKKRNISLTEEEKLNLDLEATASYSEISNIYDISLEELKKIYEDNAVIDKLALEIVKNEFHYDARHILFDYTGMSDDEKVALKAKAQSVLDRIKNGEEIADLAKEFSDDPGSNMNGGLYTAISKGSFVKEFEEAALALEEGDLYPELVESSYGYHIIKLEKLNSEVTELTNLLYNEFLLIAQEWIESAEVEEGSKYYLIGVNEESSEDIKSNEQVLPDEINPDTTVEE